MNTESIWTDENRMGGRPCLRGHRLTVSQILAEISEANGNIPEVADRFGIEVELICGMLADLSYLIEKESEKQKMNNRTYFPLLIKLVEQEEPMVVYSPQEIPYGKSFQVIETNYQDERSEVR